MTSVSAEINKWHSMTGGRPAGLETASCGFCGSSDYSAYDRVDEWSIVRCNSCGLCFTNPRPPLESLPSFYTLDYFKDGDVKRFGFFDKDGSLKQGQSLSYDQRVADIEAHFARRGSLLEVGAATGAFLEFMRGRGWKVQGVEVSQDAVEMAEKHRGIDIFCGSLEYFKTDQNFDVVCMYHSLEHVPDPAYVIERSYELLNPDGITVIEVPNLNAFDIKISKRRKLLSYDLPRHLNHFAPEVLARKLESTGFRIIDLDLYYPDFILKLAGILSRNKTPEGDLNSPAAGKDRRPGAPVGEGYPPLARKSSNWKLSLLKQVSTLFPGWRFTIVARK